MKYFFRDSSGSDFESGDFHLVIDFVNSKSPEHWKNGGDSAVEVKPGE